MLRTTTLLVGVAALATALTITLTSSASTPKISERYQGKTARQWHHIARTRLYDSLALRSRLGDQIREKRALKRQIGKIQPFTVSYAIKMAATAYGVSERDMHRVASCESGHSATASNGQYRGVYQEGPMFERGPFGQAGFSVWDPLANALTAAWTVSREGWSQWSCKP